MCTLCIHVVLYPTYVIRVRSFKFSFLFVVPEMIKNDPSVKCENKLVSQTWEKLTLSIVKKPGGCRLCKHCGCILDTEFTQVTPPDQHVQLTMLIEECRDSAHRRKVPISSKA